MKINEIIKSRRQELGLSVDDIAEKLNINRATYYRYESQEIAKFPLEIVVPLSEILNIPPETLMGWDNKKKDPDPLPLTISVDGLTRGEIEQLIRYKDFIIANRPLNKED